MRATTTTHGECCAQLCTLAGQSAARAQPTPVFPRPSPLRPLTMAPHFKVLKAAAGLVFAALLLCAAGEPAVYTIDSEPPATRTLAHSSATRVVEYGGSIARALQANTNEADEERPLLVPVEEPEEPGTPQQPQPDLLLASTPAAGSGRARRAGKFAPCAPYRVLRRPPRARLRVVRLSQGCFLRALVFKKERGSRTERAPFRGARAGSGVRTLSPQSWPAARPGRRCGARIAVITNRGGEPSPHPPKPARRAEKLAPLP